MAYDADIFETLRQRLIRNGVAHGARLRAEPLRQEFGCSASTIREVLFRLSTLGLVDFQEQRGFRVPERSDARLNQLAHLRILLEGEGTALSIRHGGVAWEARLSAAHHQLSHLESRLNAATDKDPFVDLWFDAERHFHDCLISACGSEVLRETHARIYFQFRQQLMVEDRDFGFISDNIEQHRQIVEAALAGNAELAKAKIHDHLARHLVPRTAVQVA